MRRKDPCCVGGSWVEGVESWKALTAMSMT